MQSTYFQQINYNLFRHCLFSRFVDIILFILVLLEVSSCTSVETEETLVLGSHCQLLKRFWNNVYHMTYAYAIRVIREVRV